MENIGEEHSDIYYEDDDVSCPSLDELKHHREHRSNKKYEATIQIGWLGNKQSSKSTGPDDSRMGVTASKSNSRIINTCGMDTTTEHSTRVCLPQLNSAEKVPLSESNPVRLKKHIVDVQDDGSNNVETDQSSVHRQQLVVDDSSFLASANIEDATISNTLSKESSNREQYVFGFTLLTTNKNGETIEELPDDSSFLVGAAVVEDVALLNNNDNESIVQGCNDVSSQYDVHASTLSRATASTCASIVKKKSNSNSNTHNNIIAEAVGDEKSTCTYSYGQAYYGDNTTLTSKFTSTLSALTDDTNLRQVIKRTGMSSPVNFRTINERDGSSHYLPSKLGPSFDSGDITAPCRGGANKKRSIISNNMACCVSSDETSDFTTSNETPSRQVSGYIDEEAARDWHKSSESSSRSCKLAVMFSILFLLLCGAGVAIALLLFREKDINTLNEPASSLYNECATGIPCYEETLGCNDGTIESCCGETFYSYVCDCIDFNSNLLYANCRYTEVCIDPSCEGI
jgi:hypothetical protein